MDAESFKRQFLPCHPRLYRIAYALTGNSQDAEDILQDAYCKLWYKREELTHINNTEAFCTTLVKNLCFDLLRLQRKNIQEEGLENLPLSTGISPETEAIEQDESKQIQRLIDKLPEKQRQVIRLSAINDCSPEEIEEITGLSAGNIRVLLSRARKTVKEQYLKITRYER
ncbi:MAG: RNA polymerase sigma factor [Tannerellaceae bacterium]|jgi:RNA polymerase sigma-70 factor (ECF subfamily)|nr:RNA polymerase sigma factor [Tannerellaceae bacterium]